MEGNMPYAGIFGAAQPLTILEKFFLKNVCIPSAAQRWHILSGCFFLSAPSFCPSFLHNGVRDTASAVISARYI